MKRILALFITTVLLLLALPCSAATAAAVTVDDSNQAMVEYLTGGMVFTGETVTRAELAAGLIRLAYEQVPVHTNASFLDVPLSHPYANEIYTALSMGVISQADNFNPENPVTYAQAMRMAVSFLGYGSQAESLGGYPGGYIVTAGGHSLSFQKGYDDPMTPKEVIRLLSKAAETEMFALDGFGTYERIQGATVLGTLRKIEKKQGVITANEYSSLYSPTGALTGGFALNGQEFIGAVDSHLLGYNVKVYYKTVEDRKEVCFVIPMNTNTVTLSVRDCEPIVDNCLKTESNEKYKIEPVFNFIYNGKAYTQGNVAQFFTKENVTITLVDADGDLVYETIHANDPKYLRVSRLENGIHAKAVYDNGNLTSSIQFRDDVAYQIYVADGTMIREGKFEDIKQNSFLSYYESEDKKLYTIYICTQSLKGVVETVTTSDGTIEVNGTEYIVNDAFGTLFGNIAYGVEQKFLLDEEGRIVTFANDESDYMYGWIVAAARGTGFDANLKLKIFNEQGKMDIAPLADRILIDGGSVSSSTLSDATFNTLTDDMRLVRYRKNTKENPEIIAIDYASAPAASDYLYLEKSLDINNNLVKNRSFETMKLEGTAIGPYNGTLKFTESRYDAGGTCKFFVIPNTAAYRQIDEQYAIGISNVISGQEYSFAAYDIDVYGQAGAVVALTGDIMAPVNVTTTAKIGVVDSVVLTVDEEGEQRYAVYLASNKMFDRYFLSDALQSQAANLNPGDIVRFESKKAGYITSLYIDYDFSADSVNLSNSAILGYSYGNFTNGLVYSANNEFINLINEANRNNLTANDFRLVKYGGTITYIYVHGSRTSVNPRISIRFEPLQEVKDFVTCGEDADCAVAFTIWSNPQQIFIYRFN